MAKGQQRSNREAKKPKKNAGVKPKAGASNMFAELPKNSSTPSSRKP
ncbi:MAG TPA: hypothetical protein VMU87_13770 [Stellaceae bacterium]|nr:hypothetical protein [Stellaceae bacterium]